MPRIAEELTLADVFADDSANESTFYGFSDSEIGDHWVRHLSLKGQKNNAINGSIVIVSLKTRSRIVSQCLPFQS